MPNKSKTTKAKKKLGWFPEITAQDMCKEMVLNDLSEARQNLILKEHGYPTKLSNE